MKTIVIILILLVAGFVAAKMKIDINLGAETYFFLPPVLQSGDKVLWDASNDGVLWDASGDAVFWD